MATDKVTVASDWLAGCAGCHMSLLDMDERLVQLIQLVTLTATPITDLKHPSAAGVTVGILEGAVNNSATEAVAKRMRERSKILVALGDCAVFGGIPTMRNRVSRCDALKRAYIQSESTVDGHVPTDPALATLQDARPLDQVVPVDVYLPGCPPPADAILHVLTSLVGGKKPELAGKNLDWH
jgi:NAD-reducing hydrogenase small subunit